MGIINTNKPHENSIKGELTLFAKINEYLQRFSQSKFMDKIRALCNCLRNLLRHIFLPYIEMINGKGITRRWLFTTFSLLGTMLIVIFITSVTLINNYYYNTIEQILIQRTSVTADYFVETAFGTSGNFNDSDYLAAVQLFTEGFEEKDKMELQFINSKGHIILSSSGFEPPANISMPDYSNACSSGDFGTWNGVNENHEHVLAVTYMLNLPNSNGCEAVRLIVSLQPTDSTVFNIIMTIIIIILFMLMFISFSSTYFIRSIVNPVKNITNLAGHIANGDFSIRLEKQHNDEIGDLVDSINAMASELALSEKAKNDFISSVSHELRTPLTAIKGWSETMLACDSTDEAIRKRGLGIIINETERLSSLVEQLLDFSRLQSGRMVMNFQMLDIVAEIDDVVFMFAEKAKKEGQRLTFYEPENVIPVMGDRDRLKQVIIIIIDNAMKYSQPGGEIYVYTAVSEDRVTVGVRDHGCGIPADQLSKVTERFYKANTEKGGFGIGLAVADEIIRKHNGEFHIDSVEGDGTNVTITLPIARSNNNSIQSNQNNEPKKEEKKDEQS